jgi:hypothetical protein
MTRINVVPVQELCDQHLLAEHRELTRIPNCLNSGKYKFEHCTVLPPEYVLGTGHVRFFFDKLNWLQQRYLQLHDECAQRGFRVTFKWPATCLTASVWGEYEVTDEALRINRERIKERWPKNARHRSVPVDAPQL